MTAPPPPGDMARLFAEYSTAPLNDIHKQRTSAKATNEAIKAIWDAVDAFIDWSVAEGLWEMSEAK